MTDTEPRGRVARLAGATAPLEGGLSRFVEAMDLGTPLAGGDYSDLPVIRENLNAAERKLFDEDPIVGGRVLLHSLRARNAAADLYAQPVLHNGNGDAFRHLYWNFRMAADAGVGASWAERWGNAHEDGDATQPSVERLMDLHNNLRGRQLAAANVDDDPRALRSAVRNGSCRTCPAGVLVRSDGAGEK